MIFPETSEMTETTRSFATSPLTRIVAALVTAALPLASAASADWPPAVGPVPANPAKPVAGLPVAPAPPQPVAPQLPPNWQELAARMTLADVVDVALANNLQTRATWLTALSQAADVGNKRAAYYPTLGLTASATRSKQVFLGGSYVLEQTNYGPTVTLNYLLFDFGGRKANLEETRAALLAADWQHNSTIQAVILQVEEAYYGYLNAKAQLEAADSSLHEAQVNLDAARKRHEVGVATVADVLQAQTAVSQAQLVQQSLTGQIETLRGALATAMGIPANTPFDVGMLPSDVEIEPITEAAEPLIAKAIANRPDLAAARWQAAKAEVHVRTIKSQVYPTLGLTGNANRTYYHPHSYGLYSDTWSAAALLSVPLFTGFANTYNVRKAKADAAVSETQAGSVEQQVVLDVWTNVANMKTAAQQVKTARDLLAAAQESERVALARYKDGVGSILDLLTAQAALSSARAQEIQARSNWFVAVAQLGYATGTLEPPQGAANQPLVPQPEKKDDEKSHDR